MPSKKQVEQEVPESPWANRMLREELVAPDQLMANPLNWRVHPQDQQMAMEAILNKYGWIQDVIVNDVTGHMLDGHLRVTLALRHEIPVVPVKYISVTQEEEDALLTMFDPITSMSFADKQNLTMLMERVEVEDASLQSLLARIGEEHGVVMIDDTDPPEKFPAYDDSIETDYKCPQCGYEWSGQKQ